MTRSMHILLIAPSAPPKNSPEAMQVGRFLAALDPEVYVTLVTTPIVAGWQWKDETLAMDRANMRVIVPKLPMHGLSQRLLSNRRLAPLHIPDSDFWLPWLVDKVMKQLDAVPDVIYSRSSPFSAALLARQLKHRLRVPWLMHLSDPWSGSPYRSFPSHKAATDLALEKACFAEASTISLTTEGQADYYRARYIARTKDIIVTPNMMPLINNVSVKSAVRDASLRLVYTGALYGARQPSTLLAALNMLYERVPDITSRISIDFYGNMTSPIAAAIDATPCCIRHEPISFEEAAQVQAEADVLLTIEPEGESSLFLHFMPSKNLDYIAQCKPILAITPSGSETARLCAAGYGWAVTPGDVTSLADRLLTMISSHSVGKQPPRMPNIQHSKYNAASVATQIFNELHKLVVNITQTKVS